jgi:hypothetical protein
METQETTNNKKPQTVVETVEYFKLLPRASERLSSALSDDLVPHLDWNTLRALAFACRDPKTTAKEITKSQKVMMYRRYDKLWDSISEAVRLLGRSINKVKVQPEIGEDVASFRQRYLTAILGISK